MAQRTPRANRKHTVTYRTARGRTATAKILAVATNGGTERKIRVFQRGTKGASIIVDNVPKATSEKQTGVYFTRDMS